MLSTGKNVYTEIKCHFLLPLEDIVNVVTNKDCIAQVKSAYINFLNHCYIDTEVEMKEIYTSNHMWTLFENFLIDMGEVCSSGFPKESGIEQVGESHLLLACLSLLCPYETLEVDHKEIISYLHRVSSIVVIGAIMMTVMTILLR